MPPKPPPDSDTNCGPSTQRPEPTGTFFIQTPAWGARLLDLFVALSSVATLTKSFLCLLLLLACLVDSLVMGGQGRVVRAQGQGLT